jgi:hypothetical protein
VRVRSALDATSLSPRRTCGVRCEEQGARCEVQGVRCKV